MQGSELLFTNFASALELLQCLRMPTLMVKFVGTIDKRLYSAFSQFHLLGLCHVKLNYTPAGSGRDEQLLKVDFNLTWQRPRRWNWLNAE
jgi:hypothetical protein